jgi:hypothetical protein
MAVKRVDFSPYVFDDQVEKHGYYLKHYKSLRCPCMNAQTGNHDPNCTYCQHGWQYYDGEEIKGIMTSVMSERQFLDTGAMMIGTVNLTVKANVELGYHDRIVNEQSLITFSELITRGSDLVDSNRFSIVDTIRVVGKTGRIYRLDYDYEVKDGKINWILGRSKPIEGEFYSVSYRMHPTWLVLSITNVVRDTHIKFRNPAPQHHRLPVRAVCKLEYLFSE